MPAGRRRSRGRRVVLGVTGSIAAYKSAEIVRGLVNAGAEVRCVLTPNAARFIAPLTLAALSRHSVAVDPFDTAAWDMAHLSLSSWGDVLLVAPATADTIARLAAGRAASLLDAVALAAVCPAAVCPAMDENMWRHPATQANVEKLRGYGYEVWGPAEGELASGKTGLGRLLAPSEIVERCLLLARGGRHGAR